MSSNEQDRLNQAAECLGISPELLTQTQLEESGAYQEMQRGLHRREQLIKRIQPQINDHVNKLMALVVTEQDFSNYLVPTRPGDAVNFHTTDTVDDKGKVHRQLEPYLYVTRGPLWDNRRRYCYSIDGTKRGPLHVALKPSRFRKRRP